MRCLLSSMVGLACLLMMMGQTGCSSKGVELKMDQTIPFDPSRDKEGTPSGGGPTPGKKGAAPMGKWGAHQTDASKTATPPPK
jgi:hypothetical protein